MFSAIEFNEAASCSIPLTVGAGTTKLRSVRFPVIRFGIVPVIDDDAFRTSFKGMCDALGYQLGTVVHACVLKHRNEFVSKFAQGALDVGWLSPSIALKCMTDGVASPHWAMVRRGAMTYYSVLFAREDGSVRALSDLKQVRAAWVDADSASGYLVPLASVRARGVCLSEAFCEHLFMGTHGNVVQAVVENRADVGAGFAHFASDNMHCPVASSWTEAGVNQSFSVLAVAGPIPTDVLAVHRSLRAPYIRELALAFDWLMAHQRGSYAKAIFSCDSIAPCAQEHLKGLQKLLAFLDSSTQERC